MNYNVHHRSTHFYYRNDIIGHLDQNYHLLSHICSNLSHYVQKAKAYAAGKFFTSFVDGVFVVGVGGVEGGIFRYSIIMLDTNRV